VRASSGFGARVVAVDDELHPEIGWRYSSPGRAGFSKEAGDTSAVSTQVVGRTGLPYRDLRLRQFQQGQFAIFNAEHRCRHRRRPGGEPEVVRLPGWWTSAPQSPDTSSAVIDPEVAKCLGVSESQSSKAPAGAVSDSFSQSKLTAANTVGYRATSAEQAAVFNLWASAKTPSCFATAASAAVTSGTTLPAGVKLGQATVQTMSFPTYGDKTIGYRLKIPIDYSGQSLATYEDLVVVIKGRADVVMAFNSSTDPFPTDQEQHYTELVVGRLTNT
jgi:hypothetical protein